MNARKVEPIKWRQIQNLMPIACVDVVPLQESNEIIEGVGLILRETPHQGQRWCLVGGRLCRNESLTDAISREIRAALGEQAQFTLKKDIQPDYVAQYFTVHKKSAGFD